MSETMVTVVGNVASQPIYQEKSTGGVTRFRIAVTARRFDRVQQAWKDAGTSFFTVWARRTLAANVASCVTVGEPVLVQGRLRLREGELEDRRWMSADIDAMAVGHDLSRGTAAFRRMSRTEQEPGSTPGATIGPTPSSTQEPAPPAPDPAADPPPLLTPEPI
ncbi:single-stranded DNA-binding protein [Streptomyces sp. E11-3]|uniref:single-stranded DNA-binding protein n=1 Tax=Streptomyces sp. E11-3 TaxID=3110112 RepID=UPI003980AA73